MSLEDQSSPDRAQVKPGSSVESVVSATALRSWSVPLPYGALRQSKPLALLQLHCLVDLALLWLA